MFTLFPNDTSPASAWLANHGTLLVLGTLAFAAFAVMVRFSNPRDNVGYSGGAGDGDGCDGDGDAGSCGGGDSGGD